MALTASTGVSESELVGSLYVAHAERLLGFFMRRVFDPEAARDLTAETFAQALLSQRKHRGSTEAEAEAWLYAIARHQLARYLRKGFAERRAVKRLGISLSPLSDDDIDRIDELAGTESLRQSVAEALGELSGANRDAVELRVVAELPYPEVAERLGISEATARARVSRALRSLGSALELRHREQEATT